MQSIMPLLLRRNAAGNIQWILVNEKMHYRCHSFHVLPCTIGAHSCAANIHILKQDISRRVQNLDGYPISFTSEVRAQMLVMKAMKNGFKRD